MTIEEQLKIKTLYAQFCSNREIKMHALNLVNNIIANCTTINTFINSDKHSTEELKQLVKKLEELYTTNNKIKDLCIDGLLDDIKGDTTDE